MLTLIIWFPVAKTVIIYYFTIKSFLKLLNGRKNFTSLSVIWYLSCHLSLGYLTKQASKLWFKWVLCHFLKAVFDDSSVEEENEVVLSFEQFLGIALKQCLIIVAKYKSKTNNFKMPTRSFK